MAESGSFFPLDQFRCPVCLDLLNDPVAIPCGHSYCLKCLTSFWDLEDPKGTYSCPQCRQTFSPRPALGKNSILAEVVEKLRLNNSVHSVESYAEPGDVLCDVCAGKKYKAIKSCLVCLESYCKSHLERHEEFHSRKQHKLIQATEELKVMICSQHDKLVEMYCRTDQQYVCYLCTMDEHRGHDTVSAAAERAEKQRHLLETKKNYQKMIQQKQKQLWKLRETMQSHKHYAQAVVDDGEKIFTELIRSIQRSCSEVTQRIRDQEMTEVNRVERIVDLLEQEIDDLKKRDAELDQLVTCDHHIQFLKRFQSLSDLPECKNASNFTVSYLLSCDNIAKSLSNLSDKLKEVCKEETEMFQKVNSFEILLFEPKTREQCLPYQHQFTLDSNTVNQNICLSEGNTVVKSSQTNQQYPDHPDRFESVEQVLCRESVCGRGYWEVKWEGKVEISLSYKSIQRHGGAKKCTFGRNDSSWSLYCSKSSSFSHNNNVTNLSVAPSSKIGVYVDYRAGILCFYNVHSDTLILIHKVQTRFTKPLYPGFRVHQLRHTNTHSIVKLM